MWNRRLLDGQSCVGSLWEALVWVAMGPHSISGHQADRHHRRDSIQNAQGQRDPGPGINT